MTSTYTEHQRSEAVRMYGTDGPTATSRELGIPKTTIIRWAKAAGVEAPTAAQTAAATARYQQTAKQKRAMLKEALIDDAEALRLKLSEPYQVVTDSGEVVTLPHPTARDMRDLSVAMGILVDKHIALNGIDDDGGLEETKGLLSSLWDKLQEHKDCDHMTGTGDHQ